MKITFLKVISVLIVSCSLLKAQVSQQWVATYNGGNSNVVVLDAAGNVYVTGHLNTGYGTVKYNSVGVQQWANSFVSLSGHIEACSMAVDDSENVYVTGEGPDGSNVFRVPTIKYNSSGVLQWFYNYYGGLTKGGKTLSIDSHRNVVVAAYHVAGGGAANYSILKYNSAGSPIMVDNQPPGVSIALVVASSGYFYATGISSDNGTGKDYTTVKYDSAGSVKWVRKYNGPGNLDDVPVGIVLDNSENIYISGYSTGTAGDYDYATVKYDSAGTQLWVARYNGSGSAEDRSSSISLDNFGNVYVTGYSVGNGTGKDYATIKYDNNGIQQWVQRYDGPVNQDDIANSLVIDNFSNVYVTGSSVGSGYGYDYATIKYNPAGVMQWSIRYNDSLNGNDYANSLVVDNSGNVYVTGEGNNNYVTIKYSQVTGIQQIYSQVPGTYSLSQNYPNPFNPSTKIKFGVPKNGVVQLVIYDAIGREVATLVNQAMNPGTYEVEWNATDFPSGVYFYKLTSGEFNQTKKLVLIK